VHGVPVVFSRRTDFDVSSSWMTGWKWKCVDKLVAISESAASEPRRLGFDPIIIRSAVPPVQHDGQRVRDYLSQHQLIGKTLVGTSAALSPEKGALTFVRAASEVCQHRPDVVFLHWGAAGHHGDLIRQEADKLGLRDNYRLMGFEPDVQALYSMLSVFVMASRQEALGSSVLDAMQVGIPVVSTDAGGLKETLADGRGLLCPVDDSREMAANILIALSEPNRMRDMVERARLYVEHEHSVNVMATRYLDLYRACVGRSGS
jgi:glycosyltransferase involved in cell wall biosynthesis